MNKEPKQKRHYRKRKQNNPVTKEFYLIASLVSVGNKNQLQIMDRIKAKDLKEAEELFKLQNNFNKILKLANLAICEVKVVYQ